MTAAERAKCFDVICMFGLMANTGHSPVESPDMPYRIHVALPGHGQTTCYGKTVPQVCLNALEWLESHDPRWNE
jgi:hypothetical protein